MERMDEHRSALGLLLQLSELGHNVTDALRQVPDGALVSDNVSIMVLCQLELNGPLRPHELVKISRLTSGGITKAITRLEKLGLVVRKRRPFETDKRAVSVLLTTKGHGLMRSFSSALSTFVSDAEVFIKELSNFAE